MAQMVEGYDSSQIDAMSPQDVETAWIEAMRQDLRRRMIREMAIHRINSMNASCPKPSAVTSKWQMRLLESVAGGVVAIFLGTWLCSHLNSHERS